ncbi:MAG: T9SS type A sorting domain-containing protein [Candidatus Electryoneaceae bacterium]|nr:T9SS type A sorting domain-containing protein [Candidatus Electryoneaceae bacterium]
MRSVIQIALLIIVVFALTVDAGPRSARRIDASSVAPMDRMAQADEDTALSYCEWDSTFYYWTIPNGANDRHFNVRFSPPFAPFRILEVHIPVFDLWEEQGTPGMRVIAWYSGDQFDDPGYPTEAIDSVDVPFEDLEFSSVKEGVIVSVLNPIDLRELEIVINDTVDFHIGVDLVTSGESDTLAVISDDGNEEYETDRSVVWNGIDSVWSKMIDLVYLEEENVGFNLAIQVVIEDENGERVILNPAVNFPRTVSLEPAYPNPFNSQTNVRFSVMSGIPYRAVLINELGRQIRVISAGIGQGTRQLNLNAQGLPAGIYYLQLTADGQNAAQRLIYLK